MIRGPFIATGFQDRKTGKAVLCPSPVTEETVEHVARVVGTVRPEKRWPWSKRRRCVVLIMDGRAGASRLEVLAGRDTGHPQASARSTALFYEVARRAVPMCLEGVKAAAIQPSAYRALEATMKEEYKAPQSRNRG